MTTTTQDSTETLVQLELTREDCRVIRTLITRAIEAAKPDPKRTQYTHALRILWRKLHKTQQSPIPNKYLIYAQDLVVNEWLVLNRDPAKQKRAAEMGLLHKKLTETREA
jgi:hypothetical protein